MRVAWFTLETLTAALGRAAVDGTTARAIAKITRCDLIAIDDIGMLPAGQAAAEALCPACRRRLRTPVPDHHVQPASQRTGHDHAKTLATATVDRLLHHAHLDHHRWHQPPARRGHRREGSDAADLTRREIS